MVFIPPGEQILERRICPVSGEEFVVTDKDASLLARMSPVLSGKTIMLPYPTLSPDIRMARRLAFRNEMKLYKRTCDATKQPIISIFSPDKPYTVYNQKLWWSDEWDACLYGISYSFDQTFFRQFDALMHCVPMLGSTVINSENSEFCNDTGESKNCYLCFRTHVSENCYYSYRANRSQNCMDCHQVKVSSYLYECFQCDTCHRGIFLYNCINCSDSSFCSNCRNCKDCFMCFGLENKQYCIMDQQYTPDVYKEKIMEYEKWTDEKLKQAKNYFYAGVRKHETNGTSLVGCEDCIGDDCLRCSNCVGVFAMKDSVNCRYSWDNISFRDCMDNYSAKESELSYETTASRCGYRTHFCVRAYESRECMYCISCYSCKNCFGCVSLRNRSYCIFNKQYSQAEYEDLLPRILAHMTDTKEWGEFFPFSISPYGYNETIAQEYYPIVPGNDGWQVTTGGLVKGNNMVKWTDESQTQYQGLSYIPLDIYQYDETKVSYEIAKKNIDECLKGVIKCEVSGKPFTIIPKELAFYIENHLSLPRICPDERHKARFSFQKKRSLEGLVG